MPPPLLLLQDISLSFGTSPVLAGAGLAVAAGDRLCLVGRNGSGKSTLLRIAAGLMQPDGGRRFVQPGATIRYLPQEPDLSGFATTLAYVEAGLVERRGRRPTPGPLSAGTARPDRRGGPRHSVRRRGAPRGARPRAGALARHPAARRADQSSRSARHRVARTRTGRHAVRRRADQSRPPAAGAHLARHRLAGRRHHPHVGPRLCGVRGLARHRAGAGGKRAAQARAQDRHGGGLAALRRHRATQAQPEAAGGPACSAQAAEGAARATGHGAAGGGAGGSVRPAGDGG